MINNMTGSSHMAHACTADLQIESVPAGMFYPAGPSIAPRFSNLASKHLNQKPSYNCGAHHNTHSQHVHTMHLQMVVGCRQVLGAGRFWVLSTQINEPQLQQMHESGHAISTAILAGARVRQYLAFFILAVTQSGTQSSHWSPATKLQNEQAFTPA